MTNLRHLEMRLSMAAPGDVRRDVVLAPYTSYRIGGPSTLFVAPSTEEAVGAVLRVLHEESVTPFILGRGSNLLVSDEGWKGVTLYIGEPLSGWDFDGTRADVRAGTLLIDFIREAVSRGLTGMELMAGIPGGVGGGLRMNAGAFGQEIEATVREVRGFRPDGRSVTLDRSAIEFGYRTAPELTRVIITGASFEFEREDPEVLRGRMEDVLALRAQKQPLEYPSCGSVFKRPPGYYAGALIEEVGMKGHRHGNVQVSPKHAGFIVNLGGARAAEVRELMEMVAGKVRERFGVELQREVKWIGFDDVDE